MALSRTLAYVISAISAITLVNQRFFPMTTINFKEEYDYIVGRNDNKHHQGVGLLLSRHASDALLGYECINERFLTAKFQTSIKDMNVICCHAPTEDADEDEKDEFYGQLQDILNSVQRGDITLVLVGSGSAGSVVASRLSEDPCVTVLLLEAGGRPLSATEVPIFALGLQRLNVDWRYLAEPQKIGGLGLNNRQIPIPRGKGLGGTTIINTNLYVRGNRKDYDRWEASGATGWSWNDVYPYFLKSEGNTDPWFVANGYHSTSGPLTVSTPSYKSQLVETFAAAGSELGYRFKDVNAGNQTGVHIVQGTIRDGARCSVAKAFLVPAESRKNLDIVSEALVTKILIDKFKTAVGVQFIKENSVFEVRARKEIIISAGVINSPQLLMLSGIGPRDHLESLGIEVIADLPVGKNLQDHVGTLGMAFESKFITPLIPDSLISPSAIRQYKTSATGPYTTTGTIESLGFMNTPFSDPEGDWPDFEIHLIGASIGSDFGVFFKSISGITNELFIKVFLPYVFKNTFSIAPFILRPKSRGYVKLRSTDPKEYPIIDLNFFDDPEDLRVLITAAKICVDIIEKTKSFQSVEAKMLRTVYPQCKQYELYSEEYLKCLILTFPSSLYHPVGTCKMGSPLDPTTVLDPELRVKGVNNLRVADGSIMPYIVNGNPNAPTIMIGEKASDMIKASNPTKCTYEFF